MATFSFGKFFGKGLRQPRFKAESAIPAGDDGGEGADAEVVPVGRRVSFTNHGPKDAPLFQEVEDEEEKRSPFLAADGVRLAGGASAAAGGLPGPARTVGEDGFTAGELVSMVPTRCVREGAVPPAQVIPLPPAVMRASLAAGQPAVLLSQLHHACPALFVAPASLEEDLVIALPPHKVRRLVERADSGTAETALTVGRTPVGTSSAPAWSDLGVPPVADEAAAPVLAGSPDKVKLSPPRPKFDEFQVSAALPQGPGGPQGAHGRGGNVHKRFESPFSVVSPGEAPAIVEPPFSRHMVTGHPPAPPSPGALLSETANDAFQEPPQTVALLLKSLLQGLHTNTLGFPPESVPDHVRVILPTGPLLAQIASGRIKVAIEDVTAGLEAKHKEAFGLAPPGLELQVPMRELFANLSGITPPAPPAPPVASTFETPFSVRATEDAPLTIENSPFRIFPPPAPVSHAPQEPPLNASSPFLIVPDSVESLATPVNPFSFAPGSGRPAGFELDLPVLPFDDDPVPLESLREESAVYRSTVGEPGTAPPAPAPAGAAAAPQPPVFAGAQETEETEGTQTSVSAAPPEPDIPPVPPASPLPPAPLAPHFSFAPPRAVRFALSERDPLPPPLALAAEETPDVPLDSPESTPEAALPLPEPVLPSPEPPVPAPTPAPSPNEAQRAAFASVFAPSALARASESAEPFLGDVDTLPAIALAKLPPIGAPDADPEPATSAEPAAPAPAIEDLGFGYVDDTTQLALRAVFATDRALGTQEIVDLAAGLDGLRASLLHTPHASLHSAASPHDHDEVRQFRERAGSLFEKTASLVRELDPQAREQSFTLRTGKSIVSFFAVDDVCLAVLHAEPGFRPGVREKLTLVLRSVADMLEA